MHIPKVRPVVKKLTLEMTLVTGLLKKKKHDAATLPATQTSQTPSAMRLLCSRGVACIPPSKVFGRAHQNCPNDESGSCLILIGSAELVEMPAEDGRFVICYWNRAQAFPLFHPDDSIEMS